MTHYLLSDAAPRKSAHRLLHFPKPEQSDFRTDSEFVYKTVPLGIVRGGACAVRAHLSRKPLRLIIARTPIPYTLSSGWSGTYYIETLSCGHQIDSHRGEEFKKRRGCQECLDALAIPQLIKEAA